ncbi:MAG: UDP-N-acetylmuramoyl-tripeptide--D-alanyl-D-alanine ligase [Gammaproteobacteria bacterium]
MHLSEVGAKIGAQVSGHDAWFEGVSTDTRTISNGELFCALSGPNFDGHEHCRDAEEKGAVGAIIERAVETDLPTLTVDDTRRALGRLAGAWRSRFSVPVVGVTGSNGKTTVKEMIASILQVDADVLATKGNFNNDIGVPKTLFELAEQHKYAVIEMGASSRGEIKWLAEVTQPLVGVITLCAPAHLEGFGSIDAVAKAKGELYVGLIADGTAIINADDVYANYWSNVASDRRIVKFGLQKLADVYAETVTDRGIGNGMQFRLCLPTDKVDIELPFDGIHSVSNALAAAAVAYTLDVSSAAIKYGLENATPVGGRLCVLDGICGSRIIDDTYNANPASLAAAINIVASVPGEKWLVLGDMGELGSSAAEIHHETGLNVRNAGIDRLYTFGELAAIAGIAYGDGARSYRDMGELIKILAAEVDREVTVLVKGSRAMEMERIVEVLVGENR